MAGRGEKKPDKVLGCTADPANLDEYVPLKDGTTTILISANAQGCLTPWLKRPWIDHRPSRQFLIDPTRTVWQRFTVQGSDVPTPMKRNGPLLYDNQPLSAVVEMGVQFKTGPKSVMVTITTD